MGQVDVCQLKASRVHRGSMAICPIRVLLNPSHMSVPESQKMYWAPKDPEPTSLWTSTCHVPRSQLAYSLCSRHV